MWPLVVCLAIGAGSTGGDTSAATRSNLQIATCRLESQGQTLLADASNNSAGQIDSDIFDNARHLPTHFGQTTQPGNPNTAPGTQPASDKAGHSDSSPQPHQPPATPSSQAGGNSTTGNAGGPSNSFTTGSGNQGSGPNQSNQQTQPSTLTGRANVGEQPKTGNGQNSGGGQGSTQPSAQSQASNLPHPPAEPADARLPAPTAHQQRHAIAELKALYRARYKGVVNAATMSDFVSYLLAHFGTNAQRPVHRYVALNMVWKLAARIGDSDDALGSIARLARHYQIKSGPLFVRAATMLAGDVPSYSAALALYNDLMSDVSLVATEHDYASVRAMLVVAAKTAAALQMPANAQTAAIEARHFAIEQQAYASVPDDIKTLKTHPHSLGANARLGIYYWLLGHHPVTGQAYLAFAFQADKHLIIPPGQAFASTLQAFDYLRWLDAVAAAAGRQPFINLVKRQQQLVARWLLPNTPQAMIETLRRNGFASALKLERRAAHLARESGTASVETQSDKWNRLAERLVSIHSRYERSLATLTKKPDDGPANKAVGEYLCFIKGNWHGGLLYLAYSHTPDLVAAAVADKASPTKPAAALQLGDLWWHISKRYDQPMRGAVRQRAVYWYKWAASNETTPLPATAVYRIKRMTHKLFIPTAAQ
ncbi:MAG: hypothetical protein HKL96_13850 [Phycisphaerales bacterium]|nr:hypothetical protein [Phycisphaerales bacterium]